MELIIDLVSKSYMLYKNSPDFTFKPVPFDKSETVINLYIIAN